jgi:hypothetical protein
MEIRMFLYFGKWTTVFLIVSGWFSGSSFASELLLAIDGQASYCIVEGKTPIPAETIAVEELVNYLVGITGGHFKVKTEQSVSAGEKIIYVGATEFARAHGIDANALGSEEWVITTIGDAIVIAGGRPRGTLYGVYHFLEDDLGVRWWTMQDEYVPSKPTLRVKTIDRKGKPAFSYRHNYMLDSRIKNVAKDNDGGRFASRLRLSRYGAMDIDTKYGYDAGLIAFPRPHIAHTLIYGDLVPASFISQHPTWFALRAGTRHDDGLCFENPEMRKYLENRVRNLIDTDRRKAGPYPLVYNLSYNDTGYAYCETSECSAIRRREGSEMGVLLNYLNGLADSLVKDYPDIRLETLAYFNTEEPPRTIKARDNIQIVLCRTRSIISLPVTDSRNALWSNRVKRWSQYTKHLRLWDYAWSFGRLGEVPVSTEYNLPIDYQFYLKNNVEGIMVEAEAFQVWERDMFDMKFWLTAKMMEDPNQDIDSLIQDFCTGYYGPAGKYVLEYRRLLRDMNRILPPAWTRLENTWPQTYRYLNMEFLEKSFRLIDDAEKACGKNTILLKRIRLVRAPLDRAVLIRYPLLMREWTHAGKSMSEFPFDRKKIAERLKNTEYEQAAIRFVRADGKQREMIDQRLSEWLSVKDYWPEPRPWGDKFPEILLELVPTLQDGVCTRSKTVVDSDAECGVTETVEIEPLPDCLTEALIYRVADEQKIVTDHGRKIKAGDVPAAGYHWYKIMDRVHLNPGDVIYLASWQLQYQADSAIDSKHPRQFVDVWARIKFDGPAFPYGSPNNKNSISVERVLVTYAE